MQLSDCLEVDANLAFKGSYQKSLESTLVQELFKKMVNMSCAGIVGPNCLEYCEKSASSFYYVDWLTKTRLWIL